MKVKNTLHRCPVCGYDTLYEERFSSCYIGHKEDDPMRAREEYYDRFKGNIGYITIGLVFQLFGVLAEFANL